MKPDQKLKWWLITAGCCLSLIFLFWIGYFLIESENRIIISKSQQLISEKNKFDAEWSRYRKIGDKLSSLGRGWEKKNINPNSRTDLELTNPINEAVEKQINEIKRIHEEEILGKLSETNRAYREYQRKILREYRAKEVENLKLAKAKFEADLTLEKKRRDQALNDYRKSLVKQHQLTIINLELQKKMLIFNFDSQDQQTEAERIERWINQIRNDIIKKTEEYKRELEHEYELYERQRTADYHREVNELRRESQRLITEELNLFRNRQFDEFRQWIDQRQSEVEQAIELRRFQNKD
ncbi:MAG: hypothetical protein GX075_07805 [Firmicutes bacterium]|nr:hypothetical protein [Bacillota bacterium]